MKNPMAVQAILYLIAFAPISVALVHPFIVLAA
jgi:hypothetical protein